MKHRDLDIIVRKGKNIRILLKFLMHSINSIDGIRGSAEPIVCSRLIRESQKVKKSEKNKSLEHVH